MTPLPVPELPDVILSHELSLSAVQLHGVGVVLTITLPAPPETPNSASGGATDIVQELAFSVTVKV